MKLDHAPSLHVEDAPSQYDADWFLAQLTGRDPDTVRHEVELARAIADEPTRMPAPPPSVRRRPFVVAAATALLLTVGCLPVAVGGPRDAVDRADSAHAGSLALLSDHHAVRPADRSMSPARAPQPGEPPSPDAPRVPATDDPPQPTVKLTVPIDQPDPTPSPSDDPTSEPEPTPEPDPSSDPAPTVEPAPPVVEP